MTQPQTLSELFAATTEHGKRTADLVAHAWKIGIRDGLESAAGAIVTTYGQSDLPEETRRSLMALAESLRLSAFNVQLPDHYPEGGNA